MKQQDFVNYRVDMRPLEPYTFGTELGDRFDEAEVKTGKESYIMKSGNIPEQTTILGTLRYIVLNHKGLLKSSFHYEAAERKKIDNLIGPGSFLFQNEDVQTFGVIRKISPLFLTEEGKDGHNNEIFIKTPFHYVKDNGNYRAIKLEEQVLETSFGNIRLPSVSIGEQNNIVLEYNAKEGHGKGYLSLSDKSAAPDDLFCVHLQTGNRTEQNVSEDIERFYKREMVILKKGFTFSVYVTAKEDSFPAVTVAFMGKKRSAFQFRFTRVDKEEADLEAKVRKAFAEEPERWYYALSDVYLKEAPVYHAFAIVEEKSLRNLETRIGQSEYVRKMRKSEHQFHLIESGSVFYDSVNNLNLENEKMKMIGYNTVICLGGK